MKKALVAFFCFVMAAGLMAAVAKYTGHAHAHGPTQHVEAGVGQEGHEGHDHDGHIDHKGHEGHDEHSEDAPHDCDEHGHDH